MRSRRQPSIRCGSARSRGVIESTIASTRLSWSSSTRRSPSCSPHAGDHLQQALERAHAAQHLVRAEEVVEGELALAHLRFHLGLLVLGRRLLGALDQGQDVAHAEDPRRHAVGVERPRAASSFSPVEANMIGLAGDALDRQRGAAAGIAVELRQDRRRRSRSARGRRSRRSTASWPVIASSTSSAFVGFTASRTRASSSISASSTWSRPAVSTITVSRRSALARSSTLRRRLDRIVGVGAVDGDVELRAELLQLVDRGRALRGRRRRGRACGPAPFSCERELGRGRRLARALEAGEQDRRRSSRARGSADLLAHQLGQLARGRSSRPAGPA